MTFFYDLNKRLADLAKKQDQQLTESKAAVEESKFSKLAKELDKNPKITDPDALAASIGRKKYGQKAMTAKSVAGKKKANEGELGTAIGAGLGGTVGGLPGAALGGIAGHYLSKDKDTKTTKEAAKPMTTKQKSFAKLAPPADKITFADKIAGAKKEVDEMLGDVAAEAMKAAIGKGKQQVADEGNAFTGKLKKTPKGGKFKLGNKEFTDTSEVDEGYAEMDAWLKSREKEKGTGKFDIKDTGYSKRYTRKEEPEASDDDETSTEPKRRGRPKGAPKGPERVTAKSYKYKAGRPAKTNEGDNCCPHCGESLEVAEVAPPGAKAERMVKGIKKSLSKDGKLSAKDKAIAYATTWKAKKAGKVEEESTDKEDNRAEKAGKKVAKDIEHDEGHKGKDDNRAEKAGKKVTKDIEYDDKKDKKEEKVDETTVAGSVATSNAAPKASKGGMQFGKGVYESLDRQFKQALTESVDIAETISENEGEGKTITVTASGPEADMLMQLLKAAGLSGQGAGCGCGQTPCGCEQVDENSPDWPTNTTIGGEDDPTLQTYSGGLNKPKATKQGTLTGGGLPTMSPSRQVSMEESVELERSLFKTWKNYKG